MAPDQSHLEEITRRLEQDGIDYRIVGGSDLWLLTTDDCQLTTVFPPPNY